MPRGTPPIESGRGVHVNHRGVVDDGHRGDLTDAVLADSRKDEPERVGKTVSVGVGQRARDDLPDWRE